VAYRVLPSGLARSAPEMPVLWRFSLKTLNFLLISVVLLAAGAASAQTISVSSSSLTFSAQAGGSAVSQSITVSATGGSTSVVLFPSQTWLTVNPGSATVSGTTPQTFTVTANPAFPTILSPGTYQDTNFRIIGQNNTVVVPVTLTVSSIAVTPQTLSFAYTAGSNVQPLGQNLTLTGQAVTYVATATTSSGGNWIQTPVPGSGTLPANGTVAILLNLFELETLGVGTYQGTVTITPSGSSSSVNIPVTLTVSAEPQVTVSPTTVNLNYQIGGVNNPGPQAVTLTAASTAALPYSLGPATVGANPEGCNWIAITPPSGTIPAITSAQSTSSAQSTIGYSCPSPGLPAGSYIGSVPVSVTGGSLSASSIPVNLLVSSSPLLYLPTGALSFHSEVGEIPPAAQSVTPQSSAVASNATTGQMPVTASVATTSGGSWLSVSTTTSLTGTPISVSVNPVNLSAGIYMGTVTVAPAVGSGAVNGAQTIQVTLTVGNDPAIQASVGSPGLVFPYEIGQSVPAAQTVVLSSSTGAQLSYTVTSAEATCGSVTWLSLTGSTGVTTGSFTVTVQNLATLPGGICTGSITVNATNPATGNAAIGSPLTIPVALYVASSPLLVVNPLSLSFTAAVSGAGSTQNLVVTSTDPNTNLTYTVTESTSSGGNWLAVSSSGSTAAGQNIVSVSVNPGLLSAQTYTGMVSITAAGTGAPSTLIPITLQVTSGTLSVSTNSLGFTYIPGSSNPVAQTVQVAGSGSTLSFTAAATTVSGGSWLSVTPTSGNTPGVLSVSVNPSGLAAGTYGGSVIVTAPNASGSPQTIQVTLAVNAGTVTASPAPSAGLTFTQAAGGISPAQTITVSSTPVSVSFTATATTVSGGTWLVVSPGSGTTTGAVQVSVNATSLTLGTYTGAVTITAPGASGSPITYAVTLNVVNPITITATPAKLTFAAVLNATAPAAQSVQVGATGPAGTGTLAIFPFTTTVTTTAGGTWLAVTPANGNDPGTISVSVNTVGLAAGAYTGTVTITSTNQNGATPATVTVSLVVTTAPTPVIASVANGASYSNGAVSPGEEVAIFGTNFGPSTVVTATPTGGAYPTTLSNTQVLFDGTPAPIIAVTNGQVNVMVPYGVSGRASTAVQVSYLGVPSAAISYNVAATVPGIYTLNQAGSGQGAIENQDYSINGSSNPAARGTVVSIYMTGEGITSPPSVTGQLSPTNGSGLNKPVLAVTATINGVSAPVQYAGSAPGEVYGVMQVNVLIPTTAPTGTLPIVITVGTTNTQTGVTLAVK
jgi:uncharacterized protein (TIGR03437 family)